MMTLRASILLVGLLACPNLASAVLFNLPGPPANDIDTPTPTTVDLIVGPSDIIADLNVRLNILNQGIGFASDLDATLEHVDTGTIVTLWSNDGAGGGIKSLNVLFDDQAPSALPYPFGDVSGTFRPQSALSAFNGENIKGTWRLTFIDPTGFDGEGDDLISWSIEGNLPIPSVPEPSTLFLLGTGLAALAWGTYRRRGA